MWWVNEVRFYITVRNKNMMSSSHNLYLHFGCKISYRQYQPAPRYSSEISETASVERKFIYFFRNGGLVLEEGVRTSVEPVKLGGNNCGNKPHNSYHPPLSYPIGGGLTIDLHGTTISVYLII